MTDERLTQGSSPPIVDAHTDRTIRIFGAEDSDRGGAVDRGVFKRSAENRYGRAEVPVSLLKERLREFLEGVGELLSDLPLPSARYELSEVELSVEVSAKGQLSLLGTGGEVGGQSGLTLRLTRLPEGAQDDPQRPDWRAEVRP